MSLKRAAAAFSSVTALAIRLSVIHSSCVFFRVLWQLSGRGSKRGPLGGPLAVPLDFGVIRT
jgi:hypothetical protein